MKPIKVNGVVVTCGQCVNHEVLIEDYPCKDCWKAISHKECINDVNFEDIAFFPKDKVHFLAIEYLVKKYKDQFVAMKLDAKSKGVSVEELCKQFANRKLLEVWVDGIR